MNTHMTIAQMLRETFLRGEPVIAAEFSRTHAVSRDGVHKALRTFGALIAYEGSPRNAVWRCKDVAGMARFVAPIPAGKQTAKRHAGRAKQVTTASHAMTDLMCAWGLVLAPRDIALPGRVHTMAITAVQLED